MTEDDNFITVKTFQYSHDLAVVRVLLESEGIECFAKDELTAQVNPFYSNAIGGVKLQVKQSDLDKAIEVLKSGGYLTDADFQDDNLKLYTKLDNATSKIPFVNKLQLEYRLIAIVVLSILLLAGLFFLSVSLFAKKPTTSELLAVNDWCVDKVNYDGKDFQPKTTQSNSFVIIMDNSPIKCNESLTFSANGDLTMPGFNSHDTWGSWRIVDDTLHIAEADTFGFVYNGLYTVDISNRELILKSNKTTIYCHLKYTR